MACSFHHTGEYNPSLSSIRILEKENVAGFLVLLLEEDGADGFACDGCLGLDQPLCLEVCREADDLGRILVEFGGSVLPSEGRNGHGRASP